MGGKKAIKKSKHLVILNSGNHELPDYLYQENRFTKLEELVAKQQTIEEIKDHIDNYAHGYYNIFSSHYENMQSEERAAYKDELMDQYKMFQKSSEDLVSRRQTVNSFYISVNSALVAMMGIAIGIVDTQFKIYIVLFMSLTGIILDISWFKLLDAYGTLNSAKMKVIHLIEEQLSVALYETEWRVMSDKLNNKKYRSFTESEKWIPKIFAMVYLVVIIAIVAYNIFMFVR